MCKEKEIKNAPVLSIIIVNWNTKELIRNCLKSLITRVGEVPYEIIVVDNASTDESVDMIKKEFPSVKLIVNKTNYGFSKANNQGAIVSRGQFILFLNPDTLIHNNVIDKTIKFMSLHPKAGAVGCKILREDGVVQKSCWRFPSLLEYVISEFGLNKIFLLIRRKEENKTQEVDALSGSFLLLRKDVFYNVGMFDENLWAYYEDTDLCYRIRKAGWKIYYFSDVAITHLGGQSFAKAKALSIINGRKSRFLFFQKYLSTNQFSIFKYLEILSLFFKRSLFLALALFSRDMRIKTKAFSQVLSWILTYERQK